MALDKTHTWVLPINALGRSNIEQYARRAYEVRVKNNTLLEDVLKPGYFGIHHYKELPAGSIITVLREDFTLDVTLRVYKSEPGLVFTYVMQKPRHDDSNIEKAPAVAEAQQQAEAATPAVPEGYKVYHVPNGATKGWAVQLKDGGITIKTGLASRPMAVAVAIEHAAALSGQKAA